MSLSYNRLICVMNEHSSDAGESGLPPHKSLPTGFSCLCRALSRIAGTMSACAQRRPLLGDLGLEDTYAELQDFYLTVL